MSKFRTNIKLNAPVQAITHHSRILCMGSCFTTNIGGCLQRDKFYTAINPFGIIYNPASISKSIKYIINDYALMQQDIFFHEGKWNSFDHHGSYSNSDKAACLKTINKEINTSHQLVKDLDFLIITLGTAHYYYHQPTKQIVANCHRLPTQEFVRKRLSLTEITGTLMPAIEQLKRVNKKLQVILTVSPVRYLRDGLVESNRSKAALLLAADQMSSLLSYVSYFPAYELVMDDLRDYRFFKEDMAHPTQVAIDYVYEKFQQQYFSIKSTALLKDLRKLASARQHRPIDLLSEEHRRFREQHVGLARKLAAENPDLDFKEDLDFFS